MHEDKTLPCIDMNGNEAIFRGLEITNAAELGRAFESAIEAVAPAVVGAAQDGSVAAGLGHHGGGVMATDVEEGPQHAILGAYDDNGLARNVCGQVVAGFANLIHAAHHLPGSAEDRLMFERGDAVVGVPCGGDGLRFG